MASGSARKVCVVTGSRAEYGLLRETMKRLRDDPRVELQVVVTGMHLSTEHGSTYRALEEDGFAIDERVDMLLASDEPRAIAKSVGVGTIGFADALERMRPDLVVVLGDRFEILAVAQAALFLRIPVAHIHGGELSAGAVDDAIRHAITKMAQVHFVAAEEYRRRVVQLGENPAHVFTVGPPGLDVLEHLPVLSRAEIEARLGIELGETSFLVTYHPATLAEGDPGDAVGQLLAALDQFSNASVVMTKPNADARGRAIARRLEEWVAKRGRRAVLHTNLGSVLYLNTMRSVRAVVGNSSSGIIEAPALRIPTVNIGPRQDGRLKAASVIDCPDDAEAIARAIERALSAEHVEVTRSMTPPYGFGGGASAKIADVLATIPLENIVQKRFHDIHGVAG